jgi:hypothetical protein
MASNAKKKTTFAKMNRENKVRERRLLKEARREERKRAAAAAPTEEPAPATAEEQPE